jgi:hypothetical protein
MAEVGRLLDRAADGGGGVLAMSGPPGSGRNELAAAAAREGARRGFEVLRTAAVRGQPGPLAWARLLADAGVADDLTSRALGNMGPHALDTVARALGSGNPRLPGGLLPITSSRMGHLLAALAHGYRVLGFEDATGGDGVFRQLVLARIIEPTSKLDSGRVLEEAGVVPAC